VSAASARWGAFLQQIADRHAAICAEAEEGTRAGLAATEYDFTPIAHAWMAVIDRLKELERRIVDTWHEKVSAVFEQEAADASTLARELQRGQDLAFELENRRESAEQRAFAAGARELHRRAAATQTEQRCRQCGAPLSVPVSFIAVNVQCQHCQTLGTFEPGTWARSAVASGGHAMAWEAAEGEWLAMRRAERAVHATRSPTPLALLKAYETAQIAYWTRYCSAKAAYAPELRNVPLEVRSRMQHWWTQMECEEEWRRAGSPRAKV
jgi:hypothetical protein